MIIDMLEAISEMINDANEDKVACAKIMLDRIIEGMKREKEGSIIVAYNDHLKETLDVKIQPPKKKIIPPNAEQYPIILNDDKTIREIQGLPLDAMVELDGIAMTYQDAIGKTFQTGKIL